MFAKRIFPQRSHQLLPLKLMNMTLKLVNLYSVEKIGEGFSTRYFLLNDENKRISFWNDIHYQPTSDFFHCVIEIPFDNLAKMELQKSEEHHPLWQDVRKSKYSSGDKELRYYPIFPLFNYGYFPQTWENSLEKEHRSQLYGDDDPLDLVELSDEKSSIGQILKIRVLGSFGLIDQGEIDWKVFGLNYEEADKKNIKSLEDFEKMRPGRIEAIKNWFVNYKTYDGKPKNTIFENGRVLGKNETLEIISEAHNEWKKLRTNEDESLKKLQEKRKKFKMI